MAESTIHNFVIIFSFQPKKKTYTTGKKTYVQDNAKPRVVKGCIQCGHAAVSR